MRPFDPKTYLVDVLGPYVEGSGSTLPGMHERYLLDPEDADEAAILGRLADVKALWDKRMEHAKYGPIVRTLAAAHLEAELTLGDPAERRRLADEAVERRRAADAKKQLAWAEWRAVLADVVAAGGLTAPKREQLERLAVSRALDPAVATRELDAAPIAAAPDELRPELRA